ncbi:hypothetical protein BJV78DRAFT_416150 [Lactifluus subvellereus]|nr:hypothetical protein BJV78DRAFT_416150 [Lactifluus subvellereus]
MQAIYNPCPREVTRVIAPHLLRIATWTGRCGDYVMTLRHRHSTTNTASGHGILGRLTRSHVEFKCCRAHGVFPVHRQGREARGTWPAQETTQKASKVTGRTQIGGDEGREWDEGHVTIHPKGIIDSAHVPLWKVRYATPYDWCRRDAIMQ